MNHSAPASRAAWPMGLSPLARQILSRMLSCDCSAIPVDLAIFLEFEKRLLPFALFRTLIWHVESRWTLRLESQRLVVSSLIDSLLLLLLGSEIFSAEKMRRLPHLTPIRYADSFVLHC